MSRPALVLAAAVAVAAITGCTRSLYDWGSYNSAIHDLYSGDPSYSPEEDLERLAGEIERTPPQRIPPGKAAHVGLLYSLKGDNARARDFFLMEKRLFPESAKLMDRIVARIST